MKKFLVDVPVCVYIWTRPECQKAQYEIIKLARPSVLFLVSDGGRNEKENKLIEINRQIYNDGGIDWECKVYRLYADKNYGMYKFSKKCRELVWNTVDRCIFLEDDILPSISFFRYCYELLERFKNDMRINVICGMNHLGVSDDVSSDYFFSKQGSIWGYATWKRTWLQFNDFEYGKDQYTMRLLKEQTKNNKTFWNRIKAYSQSQYYEGHVAGAEYFIEFGVYGQSQLQIIPKKNMISCMGCTYDSAHSDELKFLPGGIKKIFEMQTYEVSFPLKHNKYIIADSKYENDRNKLLAYNYPLISKKYWIERLLLNIRYGRWRSAFDMISRKIHRKMKIEN